MKISVLIGLLLLPFVATLHAFNQQTSHTYRYMTISKSGGLHADDWKHVLWQYLPEDIAEDELEEIMATLQWLSEHPLNWLTFMESDLFAFDWVPHDVIQRITEIQQVVKASCGLADTEGLCTSLRFCEVSAIVDQMSASDTVLSVITRHFILLKSNGDEIPRCHEVVSADKPNKPGSSQFSRAMGYSNRIKTVPVYIDTRMSQVIQGQKGYIEDHYRGSALRYQERMRFSGHNINLQLARHKAPGEFMRYPILDGNVTGYVEIVSPDQKVTILAGDFVVRHGGGLTLSSAGMRSGTRSMQRANFYGHRFTPYRSGVPGVHQRGVLFHYNPRWITTTIFGSKRDLSASMLGDGSYRYPSWTLTKRTENELNRNGNVGLYSAGWIVSKGFPVRRSDVRLSAAMLYSTFDTTVGNTTSWHDQHRFRGKTHPEFSLSTEVRFNRTRYSGEIATSDFRGLNYVHGISTTYRGSTIGGWQRHYGASYHTIFGNPPGALSGIGSESGIGGWISHRMRSGLILRFYTDHYQTLFPRSGHLLPGAGSEYGIQAEFRRRGGIRHRGEYSTRQDTESIRSTDTFGREIKLATPRHRQSMKWVSDFNIARGLQYQHRMELRHIRVKEKPDIGFAQVNFIRYRTKAWEVYLQHGNFNTDSHQSAVYLFEYDMVGTIRIPSFSGSGSRSSVILHFSPGSWMQFRLKYGMTRYSDRSVIGSSWDQSDGDIRSDIAFQILIQPGRR